MNNNYDAIIIGSGIGGLTCGNLLAKHGMKVLILEQHFQPGGYCTSYKRKNFIFNVPALMTDMRKGYLAERVFSYIGVSKYSRFKEIDKVVELRGPDMKIDWYSDIYKLEYEFIAKFPDEKKAINKFFKLIKEIYYEMNEAHYQPTFFQMLTYPIKFPRLVKYGNYTFKQFMDKFFKNEKLKEFLSQESLSLGTSREKVSAIFYIAMIMSYAAGGVFSPEGGFQKISDAFAVCFKEYDGTLCLKTEVKKILIKNSKAIGVELNTGDKIYGKYIISNADTKRTFLELIDVKHLKTRFLKKIKGLVLSHSGFVVNLVVKMDLTRLQKCGWQLIFPEYGAVDKMFELESKNKIDVDNCAFVIEVSQLIDKEEQADSMSVVSLVMSPAPYDYKEKWFSDDKIKKENLKEEIANKLIKRAEKIIPDLSKNIIFKDVYTPVTAERYTSSSKGAWFDIELTPKQCTLNRIRPETQIKNLYLTGAKGIIGPGLSAVVSSGLYTADKILNGELTRGRVLLRDDLVCG